MLISLRFDQKLTKLFPHILINEKRGTGRERKRKTETQRESSNDNMTISKLSTPLFD